ncbi:HEAT repeat domain-containing protein [Sphingomonas sp. 28-63-12]|uniref:HEAT repeat domain-containing protein n=1 Tax=Sphingomonas sp. 28-63-12 TaxID=1970434 RepID=UPI000BD77DC7|nr:MAG: hypothetical protein B7Y47_14445 [Sphingomonas sp. 28-63-12]
MSSGTDMPSAEDFERLIGALGAIDPPFSSLGTPFLVDTRETAALVQHGSLAVTALEAALSSANPTIAMYAAYCLGLIGDARAVPTLREALRRHRDNQPKTSSDFAIESAIAGALNRLGEQA